MIFNFIEIYDFTTVLKYMNYNCIEKNEFECS